MKEAIFFDLETDGLGTDCQIIQIAAAAVDLNTWKVLGTREWKCKFDESKSSPDALAINHYDHDVWAKHAIPLGEAMDEFHAFCSEHKTVANIAKKTGRTWYSCQLAGFNTEGFDMPILQRYWRERGIFFIGTLYSLDVLQLARWRTLHRTDLVNNKLTTLCEKFGIDHKAHDALGDVLATVELARRLLHE